MSRASKGISRSRAPLRFDWPQRAGAALRRLRRPYLWTLGVLWLLGVGEQVLEEWYIDPTYRSAHLRVASRIGLLAMALYTPLMLRWLHIKVGQALKDLRAVVLVSDREYEQRVHYTLTTGYRVQLLWVVVSVVVVVGWFVVLHNRFPVGVRGGLYLPAALLPAAFMLLIYSVLGWAMLSLFYTTVRLGMGLGRLALDPLVVDPFDPAGLLPFGRLAMFHSLSVVGVVFMLILSLGQPTELLDYLTIILLSSAGALAWMLPVWAVHMQIVRAKIASLAEIYAELRKAHARLVGQEALEPAEYLELNNRVNALVNVRKVIQESPRWPYRTEGSVARALLAALTPLIYFVLYEVLRVYIVPFLTGHP